MQKKHCSFLHRRSRSVYSMVDSMTEKDLTKNMRPHLQAIARAVREIEDLLDNNPMVPFEINEDEADALRWLSENIFV